MSVQDPELSATAVVFRLALETELFCPKDAPFPNTILFETTSADEKEAKATEKPIRVSVWDVEHTSPTQAVRIREADRGALFENGVRAYTLEVKDVRAVAEKFKRPSLRVVRDTDNSTSCPPPEGWQGHCGIEGLDRAKGEPRTATRNIRDELVQLVKHFETVLPEQNEASNAEPTGDRTGS